MPTARPIPAVTPTPVRPARCARRVGQPAHDKGDLLDQCAAKRRRNGQNRLCRSADRVDHRHRRNAATRDACRSKLPAPDDREMPPAVAVRTRCDQFGHRGQRAQPLTAPQHVDRGGGVVAQPRGGLVAVAVGQFRDAATARRTVRSFSMPSISAAARRGASAYSAAATSRGAGHGESSRSGQAGPWCADRAIRVVQVRSPVNRASKSAVSTASARDRNGPTALSPFGVRTIENRGKASSVSTIHHQRCGNFDRRLYGGACAASSRSSRTPASRSCAHSTWSTAVASATISLMRARGSVPLKYWPARLRRSTAVPT